ncbi:MAG: M56 family peptidase [Xanthomonadales bacterium PRO7]|nr:M56 family peptidase [Xanthomonadales bacterium PRO7]
MIASMNWMAAIDAIGTALLHFLWQGAVLGLLYFVLRPLCTTAHARYRLGLCLIAALALCPLLTLAWLWPAADSSATSVSFGTIAAVGAQELPRWQLRACLPWLVAVWFGGMLVMASRSLWQWRNLQRLVRDAGSAGAVWESRMAHLRERFGITRPVRLLASARVLTPMLVGWIKPAILLPASLLSGFPPQQVELIIAHELGHIRRWDYLVNLAQVVVETVLFYHPVVHWISRDVRNAREECCDDLVLQVASGKALAYARALAGLEELRHDPGFAGAALGAGGGELLARIRRIVGVNAIAQPAPRNVLVPMVLAAATLAFGTWRVQQHNADFALVLDALPARSLAVISGNPQLIAVPEFTVPLPATHIAPLALASVAQADVQNSVRIDPVHTALTAVAVERVRDLAPEPVHPVFASPPISAPVTEIAPSQVVQPVYPQRAMLGGIQGNVELSYRIGADGAVTQIRVLHARPAGLFEDAARTALGAWRFPAAAAGQQRTQNFAFALRGKDDKCQSPTGTLICRHPGD